MQKLHGLMLDIIERKIRLRAHELYEERGHGEGFALEDWLKAESEVLKSILAPLYSRSRTGNRLSSSFDFGWGIPSASQKRSDAIDRPSLTSYDSGYEHSPEHWADLQHLLCKAEGGLPMLDTEDRPCHSCASSRKVEYLGEICLHFPGGLESLDKPLVWVFPKIAVCLDCGSAQFTLPGSELKSIQQNHEKAA